MKINIFTPPKFTRAGLNIQNLDNITNKQWQYTSNGRASIFHILNSINIDIILVPIYICHTILIPLKKLNITPVFYDIDMDDLNPSLSSIEKLSKKHNIKTVLVASMYGNPANLIEIEKYCKKNNIFLIDDAAQSFGAKLNNRYIGTFGDAGFFSFSPGKPTAGHMGSFFWSKNKIEIKRTNHFLTHYFRWLDFSTNRYKIYSRRNPLYRKFINLSSRILLKFTNIDNDNICKFEKNIIGGILKDALNNKFIFREKYQNIFYSMFNENKYFRVLKPLRGEPSNHKFIIIFHNKIIAQSFIKYMKINSIYVSNGYRLLSNDLLNLPNAKDIEGRVVEMPIEDSKEKMNYLFKKVEEFENRN